MHVPVWSKPALWGAVVGAMAIVGFSQLDWKTAPKTRRAVATSW